MTSLTWYIWSVRRSALSSAAAGRTDFDSSLYEVFNSSMPTMGSVSCGGWGAHHRTETYIRGEQRRSQEINSLPKNVQREVCSENTRPLLWRLITDIIFPLNWAWSRSWTTTPTNQRKKWGSRSCDQIPSYESAEWEAEDICCGISSSLRSWAKTNRAGRIWIKRES